MAASSESMGGGGTEHAFSHMQGDLDRQRLLGERPLSDPLTDILAREIQHQER